jgi:hypothetical protein
MLAFSYWHDICLIMVVIIGIAKAAIITAFA